MSRLIAHIPHRFRLVGVLALLAFALAMGAVARGAQPVGAAASPTCSQPCLVMWADFNFGGVSIALSQDTPDLRAVNFDNFASSFKLGGGLGMAAIYTGPNYSGTCFTVTEWVPRADYIGVGNDSVSSVKLHSTCNASEAMSYVYDVKVVHGSSPAIQCPGGYSKKLTNLNDGVGGDYVYACLKWGINSGDAIQELYTMPWSGNDTPSCNGKDQLVDGDLNAGVTHWYTTHESIYFCIHRPYTKGGSGMTQGTSGLWNVPFTTAHRMRDLNFWVSDTLPKCVNTACVDDGLGAFSYLEYAVTFTPQCQAAFDSTWWPVFDWYQGVPGTHPPRVLADAGARDLNAGYDTAWKHMIYGCVKEFPGDPS